MPAGSRFADVVLQAAHHEGVLADLPEEAAEMVRAHGPSLGLTANQVARSNSIKGLESDWAMLRGTLNKLERLLAFFGLLTDHRCLCWQAKQRRRKCAEKACKKKRGAGECDGEEEQGQGPLDVVRGVIRRVLNDTADRPSDSSDGGGPSASARPAFGLTHMTTSGRKTVQETLAQGLRSWELRGLVTDDRPRHGGCLCTARGATFWDKIGTGRLTTVLTLVLAANLLRCIVGWSRELEGDLRVSWQSAVVACLWMTFCVVALPVFAINWGPGDLEELFTLLESPRRSARRVRLRLRVGIALAVFFWLFNIMLSVALLVIATANGEDPEADTLEYVRVLVCPGIKGCTDSLTSLWMWAIIFMPIFAINTAAWIFPLVPVSIAAEALADEFEGMAKRFVVFARWRIAALARASAAAAGDAVPAPGPKISVHDIKLRHADVSIITEKFAKQVHLYTAAVFGFHLPLGVFLMFNVLQLAALFTVPALLLTLFWLASGVFILTWVAYKAGRLSEASRSVLRELMDPRIQELLGLASGAQDEVAEHTTLKSMTEVIMFAATINERATGIYIGHIPVTYELIGSVLSILLTYFLVVVTL
ncbi:unnamed protein product [Pedinophyceae sp. YPF-701]|nr:unnamed protein product [Pedinophyceae sp. YPF-701]